MTNPYHIQTETQYSSFKAAKDAFGILGLNADNCGDYGFVVPTNEPRPEIAAAQKATKADKPTENPDGSWSYKWTVTDKTAEELAQHQAMFRQNVMQERDRRLEADFEFNGKMFQRDSKSLDRITGAATLAGFAIANGAQPGDLRWANPARDFGWIASDNTVVPMDAQTTFQFGQVAAGIETSIVFAAKALREMDPIPEDFADDKWWP